MTAEVSNRANSSIPRELTGPLPRNVRLRAGSKRVWTILGFGFLVAGIIYLAWSSFNMVHQYRLRAALRASGQVTIGTVSLVSYQKFKTMVRYTFAVNGVGYSGRSEMPDNVQLDKSEKINIRYLPSNPAMNHPADWEWSAWEELGPVSFAVVIIAITAQLPRYLRRERRLAREGIPAEGVVGSCTRDRNGLRVAYEFRTEKGERFLGSSDCEDVFQPGQSIWILYLPGDPARNRSYPLSDYDIVG